MKKSFVKNFLYVVVFCCIFALFMKYMFSKEYMEATILNGLIGYFLLFLYFIFFNRLNKNVFLFLLSNLLNILFIEVVFSLILEKFFYIYVDESINWVSLFSVVVLYPFFISGAIVEFLFYQNNRQFSEKINNILTNKKFRYLILLNIGSLYFYIQLILIISLAKGLEF